MPSKPEGSTVAVGTSQGNMQPTPKKPKTGTEQRSDTGAGGTPGADNQQLSKMKQKVAELPNLKFSSFSAPMKSTKTRTCPKLMAAAQKSYLQNLDDTMGRSPNVNV